MPANKELAPSIQFASLLALWCVWSLSAALVVRRDLLLRSDGKALANADFAYGLLLGPFPLVLSLAGILFLRRLPAFQDLGSIKRHVFTFVVTGITIFGLALFVTFGVQFLQQLLRAGARWL